MLNVEDIQKYSRILKNGGTVENPKVELKRQWWDFSQARGRNEFLKDITAIANTPGEDGYIIIGIDEDGAFFNAPFPAGAYNDPSKISGLIYRKIVEPMDVEFYEHEVDGKNIVVVHIPKSQNKPHVMKYFNDRQHYIPIRKGTSVCPASKYDLDLMYAERNRLVIPPYKLDIYLPPQTKIEHILAVRIADTETIAIRVYILNLGQYINMIKDAELILIENEHEIFKFKHNSFLIKGNSEWKLLQYDDYITLPSNNIFKVHMGFEYEAAESFKDFIKRDFSNIKGYLVLTDLSGERVRSEITDFMFFGRR